MEQSLSKKWSVFLCIVASLFDQCSFWSGPYVHHQENEVKQEVEVQKKRKELIDLNSCCCCCYVMPKETNWLMHVLVARDELDYLFCHYLCVCNLW